MTTGGVQRWGRPTACLGLDALAVVVFVAIGRSAHHHGLTPAGVVSTLWPFAAGLGTGWLAAAATGDSARPAGVRTGVAAWLSTVAVGMVLRVVAGQGTAVSFVVVALVFVGLFVLGWRSVAAVATSVGR